MLIIRVVVIKFKKRTVKMSNENTIYLEKIIIQTKIND